MYRASFIILYYGQQMIDYLTNFHNPTNFDTLFIWKDLIISDLLSHTSISNAAVGNAVLYLTLRRLMSYIYGAPILDVSRSHTTTQHSR